MSPKAVADVSMMSYDVITAVVRMFHMFSSQVVVKLKDLGAYEISLGDTVGVGTPGRVRVSCLHLHYCVPVYTCTSCFLFTPALFCVHRHTKVKHNVYRREHFSFTAKPTISISLVYHTQM